MNYRTIDGYDFTVHIHNAKIIAERKEGLVNADVFIELVNGKCINTKIVTLGYKHPESFAVIDLEWQNKLKDLIYLI